MEVNESGDGNALQSMFSSDTHMHSCLLHV